MRIFTRITVFIAVCISLAACSKDDGDSAPGATGRVLLVYMATDEYYIDRDCEYKREAIVEGVGKSGGEVVIYSDRYGQTPKLERIRRTSAGVSTETVAEYGEENSASAETLRRAVNYIRTAYPDAAGYGLLVFAHASGWLPAGALQKPLTGLTRSGEALGTRSVVIDDDQGIAARKEMEISDFASAIPSGMFDFIVFETCLTANVEVAYPLRDKADYLFFSAAEILSPGFTPVYPDGLKYLTGTGGSTGDNLTKFAEEFFDYASTGGDHFKSATVSVVDCSGMQGLAVSIKDILGSAETADPDPGALQSFDRPGYYGDSGAPLKSKYFDLEDYVRQIAAADDYAAFREQLDKTVIWEKTTAGFMTGLDGGFSISRHCGLTTYIEQDEFPFINGKYRQTAWYKATR